MPVVGNTDAASHLRNIAVRLHTVEFARGTAADRICNTHGGRRGQETKKRGKGVEMSVGHRGSTDHRKKQE